MTAVAAALGACAGDVAEIAGPIETDLSANTTGGFVRLVKLGPAGTTATFSISATGGQLPLGSTVTIDACDETEPCPSYHVWLPTDDGQYSVTITETGATGNVVLERINVISQIEGTFNIWGPAPPTVTVLADGTHTVAVRFKNVDGPQEPALRLEKTADNGTVDAGSPMSFSMTVYSDGPAMATGVTLSDPLPSGTDIEWSTATAGCVISGVAPAQTLNCDFGDLAAGATRTVTVTSPTSGSTECRTYANTATVNASNHASVEASAQITVNNCEPQVFAGCTPGFWKQDQHFQYWTAPYTPATSFGTVFVNAFPGKTLLDVVKSGGGGLTALGRHAVAALLNSASPDVAYGMTTDAVISAFNAAVASGSYEGTKNAFEALNELGCTAKD